jgi:hypothetical protein
MPEPIAICIEDLGASASSGRYLRCVALPGRQPGLRLDAAGAVLWRDDAPDGCELWVSADQQLILYRPEAGAAVTVHRAGRSLAVPAAKPVVLLAGDELAFGVRSAAPGVRERRLRIHLHGTAPTVHPPSPLEPETRAGTGGKAVAAALALAAALGASDCRKPVEVRDRPPSPPMQVGPDAGSPALKPDTAPRPIEVRDRPPEAPSDPDREK